ncbi:MAG TPA: Ig-like domain-containing protein, partial [Myxococcota bacterium]|nr:Ig-like domain-containing protein [Myxococcota bacterium]
AQPDTTDTADPDTTEPDTTQPDTTDTAQPDTTDTTEPDTTPATLATLLAPFAGSANNFETTPGATVAGLVVTLVKPDIGTELGGFFAVDPSDMTPVFFAPAAGAAGVPAAGSTITVKVDTLKNVAGVPMVTAFSNLSVTSTGADLDALATNIDAWTAAEYADSQSTYFDLTGTISGASVPAGGGLANGYHRFGFTSDGLTAVSDAVQVRMPLALINTLAIEDGCVFSITGGGVWAYRGPAPTDVVQYQPMVVDSANLTVLCDAPTLTGASTDGDTTVVLTFSRPLDPTTVEAGAFTFEPALTVNAVALSDNGKTVTLTTSTHEAASYTVTVDETVTDVLGAPIDPNADTFTFETGAVVPDVIAGWNFGTDAATFTLNATSGVASNLGAKPIQIVGASLAPAGTAGNPIGSVGGNTGLSVYADKWDAGANTKYWLIDFDTTGYENIVIKSAFQRGTNTGPRDYRVEYSVDGTTWTAVGDNLSAMTTGFANRTENRALPAEANNRASLKIRWLMISDIAINTNPVASGGNNRIDDIVIEGTPIP